MRSGNKTQIKRLALSMACKDLCEIGTAGTAWSQSHGGLLPVSERFTQELCPPRDQAAEPEIAPLQHPWHHTCLPWHPGQQDTLSLGPPGHRFWHPDRWVCKKGSSWRGGWGQMVARIRGLSGCTRNLHDLILLQM